MPVYVEIAIDCCCPAEMAAKLQAAARETLQHQNAPQTSALSILISDDEHLHALNLQFREVDAPTDVLSFPSDFRDPQTGEIYLGDVAISYPRAEAQARTGGHSLGAELQLLTIHGVLHLLGHDHAETDEKARMWAAQREILTALGAGEIRISE